MKGRRKSKSQGEVVRGCRKVRSCWKVVETLLAEALKEVSVGVLHRERRSLEDIPREGPSRSRERALQ